MAAPQDDLFRIFRPHPLEGGLGRLVRHDVVVFRHRVDHRHVDCREIHGTAVQLQRSLQHGVLPVQLLHHLAEGFAREGNLIGRPAVDRHERLHVLVVANAVEHLDRAGQPPGGTQHVERRQQDLAGHVPQRVHDSVDVEVALVRPLAEEPHSLEVHGSGQAGHVAHRRLRVGSHVHQRQRAAHAVAQQVDFRLARVLEHPLDALGDAGERVVLQPQAAVLVAGHTPVDQVHVVPLLHQELHHALARRQVEDVRLAHQRGHDQQGNAVDLVRLGAVVVQLHRAVGMDGVLRRRTNLRVFQRDVLEPDQPAPHDRVDGRLNLAGDIRGRGSGSGRHRFVQGAG